MSPLLAVTVNEDVGQVINGTVDQGYLCPFPVTAKRSCQIPGCKAIKGTADGWDASDPDSIRACASEAKTKKRS